MVKNPADNAGGGRDMGLIPGKIPPEKVMATHSDILAWRIPWIEEPGELQPTGLKKAGNGQSDVANKRYMFD